MKRGYKAFNNAPKFKNVDEAEKWLEREDERGNVVGDYKDKVPNFKKKYK